VPFQDGDDNWCLIWHIKTRTEIPDTVDIKSVASALSDNEKQLSIAADGNQLKVTIKSRKWSLEGDLYGYYYKAFEIINQHLGEISTIQDSSRDSWPPWVWKNTTKKLKPIDYYIQDK
jgi:hypothetical protein